MGRHDPGLVATLLLLIPGLWSSFSFLSMPNLSVCFSVYFSSCVYSFGCNVGVPWLLYWLFLLGFLVLVTRLYGSRVPSKRKRAGSRHQKARQSRRRKLVFSWYFGTVIVYLVSHLQLDWPSETGTLKINLPRY